MTSSFEKALAAFREHAAAYYKVPAGKVDVGPTSEEVARRQKETVGGAFAFSASSDKLPGVFVRGWASGDGAVVTARQGLGLLFTEAGLWSDKPSDKPALSAEELAARLVWSMGTGAKLIKVFRDRVEPPTLLRNPDGSGTLKFLVEKLTPSPGPPQKMVHEVTVTLTAKHEATAVFSDNLNT